MNYSSLLQDVLIPAGLKLGGYPDDVFLNLTEKEREEFECQICYMVLKDARQCENHHYFCAPCIFSWSIGHGENHDKCPVCRCDSAYKTCPQLDDRLSRKRVKCISDKCEWRGFLRDFRSHGHGLELVGGKSEEILPDIIAQLPQHRPPTPPQFFFGIPFIPSHDNMFSGLDGGHLGGARGGQRFHQMRGHLQDGRDRLMALMLTFSEVLDMRRRNIMQFHEHREQNRVEQMEEVQHLGERLGDVATALMFLLEEARSDMNQMHAQASTLPASPTNMSPLSSPRVSEASNSMTPLGMPSLTRQVANSGVTSWRDIPRNLMDTPPRSLSSDVSQLSRSTNAPSLSTAQTRTSSFPLIHSSLPVSENSSTQSSPRTVEPAPGVRSLTSGLNSTRFSDTASRITDTPPRVSNNSSLGTVSDSVIESRVAANPVSSAITEESSGDESGSDPPQMSTRASISRYRRQMIRRRTSSTEVPVNQLQASSIDANTLPLINNTTNSIPRPGPSPPISTSNTRNTNSENRQTSNESDSNESVARDWGTFTVSSNLPVNNPRSGTLSIGSDNDTTSRDSGNITTGISNGTSGSVSRTTGNRTGRSGAVTGTNNVRTDTSAAASSGLGTSSSSSTARRNILEGTRHSVLTRPSETVANSTAGAQNNVGSSAINSGTDTSVTSNTSVRTSILNRPAANTTARNQDNNGSSVSVANSGTDTPAAGNTATRTSVLNRPVSRASSIQNRISSDIPVTSNNSSIRSTIFNRPASRTSVTQSNVEQTVSHSLPSARLLSRQQTENVGVINQGGVHHRTGSESSSSSTIGLQYRPRSYRENASTSQQQRTGVDARRTSIDTNSNAGLTRRSSDESSSSRRHQGDSNPNRRTSNTGYNSTATSSRVVRRRASNEKKITARLPTKSRNTNP